MINRMSLDAGRDFIKAHHGQMAERTLCAALGWPLSQVRAEVVSLRAAGELAKPVVVETRPNRPIEPLAPEPPVRLPEGDAGWHTAARYLHEWGHEVTLDRTKLGTRVTIDGQTSNVVELCAMYVDRRRRRARS